MASCPAALLPTGYSPAISKPQASLSMLLWDTGSGTLHCFPGSSPSWPPTEFYHWEVTDGRESRKKGLPFSQGQQQHRGTRWLPLPALPGAQGLPGRQRKRQLTWAAPHGSCGFPASPSKCQVPLSHGAQHEPEDPPSSRVLKV